MNLGKNLIGFSITGLFALLVIGCGAAPTPPPTSAPPTAIPSPTAIPPTPTPPSSSLGGGMLLDAMAQVKAAKSYRVNLIITGTGNFANAGGQLPASGSAQEPQTLIQMQGQVSGENAQFSMQGRLTGFLGIEPDKTFEVISHNGNAYLKGPVPLLNALEDAWYLAPTEAAGITQPPLSPRTLLDSFGENGISPDDIKKTGTETMDGVACDIYAGDKTAVTNAFNRLGAGAGATPQDVESIDNAEFNFWVCEDGYLHQVQMVIEAHDPQDPEQKGALEVLMEIQDFDKDITITPPDNPIRLNLPKPNEAQPTPTP